MTFYHAHQTVIGNGGVNRFDAPYTLEGKRLSIGRMRTTLVAGSLPLMNQERDLVKALKATRSFVIEDNVLTLLDETSH